MSKISNYRQISGPDGHIAKHEPFRGNTMWATTEMGVYCVFSYATCIAQVVLATGEKAVTDERFSRTTSRHQGICRAWL